MNVTVRVPVGHDVFACLFQGCAYVIHLFLAFFEELVIHNSQHRFCRNDLMVHVSFFEPTGEKVHQQCSRRVCAKTRSGLSDRITNKKHRRGTEDLSTTKALHTRFKASHARSPFAESGPRFFHTWNCREERGLTVWFASTLSPCPVWSADCMRVIALSNRLAHTAGSFLILSCREFSHSPSARLLR